MKAAQRIKSLFDIAREGQTRVPTEKLVASTLTDLKLDGDIPDKLTLTQRFKIGLKHPENFDSKIQNALLLLLEISLENLVEGKAKISGIQIWQKVLTPVLIKQYNREGNICEYTRNFLAVISEIKPDWLPNSLNLQFQKQN